VLPPIQGPIKLPKYHTADAIPIAKAV